MDRAPDTSTTNNPTSGCDEHFQQWWSTARQSEEPPSPYDFLLNFGIRPDVVQQMSWDILYHVCNVHTMQPGLIDYFVRQLFFTDRAKEAPFLDWKNDQYRPILKKDNNDGWGPGGRKGYQSLMLDAICLGPPGSDPDLISVQDIKSLSKLVNLSGKEWNCRHSVQRWFEVVLRAMHRNYSSELIQYLADQVPSVRDGKKRFNLNITGFLRDFPTGRRAVDIECVLGLEKLSPKLDSLCLWEEKWTEPAFLMCIDMLKNTTSIKEVDVQIPRRLVTQTDTNSSTTTGLGRSAVQCDEGRPCAIEICRIKSLSCSDEDEPDESPPYAGGLAVARLLPCMPNLKKLSLRSLGSLSFKEATPYIIQTIHNSKLLRRLDLINWDSPVNKLDVLCVLESLRATTSLESLYFSEGSEINSDDEQKRQDNYEPYANKIIDILERHTTLTEVTFSLASPKGKLKYYLDLNSFGRSTARDSNTTLVDFVALLCSKTLLNPSHYSYHSYWPMDTTRVFNIYYGLLREAPGLWSTAAGSVCSGRSRKRKQAGAS